MAASFKSKIIKVSLFLAAGISLICCNAAFVFASNAQADKVKQAFQSAQNTGNTFNTANVSTFTSNFLGWVEAWMNGLGNVVPVLTVTMIIIGIVLSLVTSFSKRVRGFGLGMALFALGVFLLWLFLPTIIQWFYT